MEIRERKVAKEYVCRVQGEFTEYVSSVYSEFPEFTREYESYLLLNIMCKPGPRMITVSDCFFLSLYFCSSYVECNQPILVFSHKLGLSRVDPQGKPCSTTFTHLSFNGETTLVKCESVLVMKKCLGGGHIFSGPDSSPLAVQ